MWEKIPESDDGLYDDLSCLLRCVSHRRRIPGGWIVRTITYGFKNSAVAQIFISDPSHEWNLEKPTNLSDD